MITMQDRNAAEAFVAGEHTALMDALDYSALVDEFQSSRDEARRLDLWRAIEAIKNRYGGHPPKGNQ